MGYYTSIIGYKQSLILVRWALNCEAGKGLPGNPAGCENREKGPGAEEGKVKRKTRPQKPEDGAPPNVGTQWYL